MALQIHAVMQDACDFDHSVSDDPVQEEVTSTPAVSGNMQRTQAGIDLAAGFGPPHVGTVGEFTDRLDECLPIEAGLSRPETLRRPAEDVCEIEFCPNAEANAPFPLGHEISSGGAGNDLFGEVIEISFKISDAIELLELASL